MPYTTSTTPSSKEEAVTQLQQLVHEKQQAEQTDRQIQEPITKLEDKNEQSK
jgi:hypothetical protein